MTDQLHWTLSPIIDDWVSKEITIALKEVKVETKSLDTLPLPLPLPPLSDADGLPPLSPRSAALFSGFDVHSSILHKDPDAARLTSFWEGREYQLLIDRVPIHVGEGQRRRDVVKPYVRRLFGGDAKEWVNAVNETLALWKTKRVNGADNFDQKSAHIPSKETLQTVAKEKWEKLFMDKKMSTYCMACFTYGRAVQFLIDTDQKNYNLADLLKYQASLTSIGKHVEMIQRRLTPKPDRLWAEVENMWECGGSDNREPECEDHYNHHDCKHCGLTMCSKLSNSKYMGQGQYSEIWVHPTCEFIHRYGILEYNRRVDIWNAN